MTPSWLSPQQAPLATAFYKRCGSKEKAKRDERVAVIRNHNQQIVACLRLASKQGHWLLRALLVDPQRRNQGLALTLLRFVHNEHNHNHAAPIWCFPYPHLESLYQQAGYRLVNHAQQAVPAAVLEPYQAYCRKQPLLLMVSVGNNSQYQN